MPNCYPGSSIGRPRGTTTLFRGEDEHPLRRVRIEGPALTWARCASGVNREPLIHRATVFPLNGYPPNHQGLQQSYRLNQGTWRGCERAQAGSAPCMGEELQGRLIAEDSFGRALTTTSDCSKYEQYHAHAIQTVIFVHNVMGIVILFLLLSSLPGTCLYLSPPGTCLYLSRFCTCTVSVWHPS